MHIFLIVGGLWAFGSGCIVAGWIAHAKVHAAKLAMAGEEPLGALAAKRLV